MLEIIREFSFDVNFETGKFKRTDGSTERIKLVQNDNESTKFKFNFEEEIADNTNVLVRIRHYSGYVKEYPLLVENQKADLILANDILYMSGNLEMSITLIGTNNEILTAIGFYEKIEVRGSLEGNTEIPEQEKNVLVDLISQVNASNQETRQATEDAETAIQNANTATQNANDATTNANTATQNANVAAQNANNAVTELDNRLATKVDKVNGKELSTNDYDNTEKEKNETNRTEILRRALITETGNKIELEINNQTYILTAKLYDKNNNLISTSNSIDLPLETMIVNATYNNNTKKIVLTLQSGSTVEFSIADLIDGLVNETTFNETIEELEAENTKLKQRVTDLENNELVATESGESIDINDSANAEIRGIKITGKSWQNNVILPSSYTQVDYIKSSGTQYIDTGIIASNIDRVKCIFGFTHIGVLQGLFGGRYSSNNDSFQMIANASSNLISARIGTNVFTISADTNKHYADLSLTEYKIDNVSKGTYNRVTILDEDNLVIFARRHDSETTIIDYSKAKIFRFQIYSGGILVRDFIPCYRNSDNEVGLYDLVNNVFYTNQGTGNFSYGNEAVLPNTEYEQEIHNCSSSINFKIQNSNGTQEQNITFPLQSGQVLAQDDFLADDGIHHIRRKIEITSDNVSSYVTSINKTSFNIPFVSISKTLLGCKLNYDRNISLINRYFEITSAASISNETYATNFETASIYVFDERFTSIEVARELLVGTIIEIRQSQETIETYTEQQAQAWEQIKALRTYKNETHISSEDETKPTLEVTYVRDLPKKIDILSSLNQSLSYASYSAMITAFNALANNVYNVGQNVLIVTLEVPDLWISGIESTSSTYTYTTDEAFKTALATNGYVQVGYYKLSALETQKVDLTDYVKNTNYATWNVGGTVKVTSSNGIVIDSTGQISTLRATNIEIDGKTNNYKPIVPSNLDYAVSNIVGHHTTLTQAQYDALETKVSDTYYYIVEE